MTMPSRGVSLIQRKATGADMKCGMKKGGKTDARKGMLKNKDKMSVGMAKSAGPMPGYYKGGKVDGCIKKGHTKGKVV